MANIQTLFQNEFRPNGTVLAQTTESSGKFAIKSRWQSTRLQWMRTREHRDVKLRAAFLLVLRRMNSMAPNVASTVGNSGLVSTGSDSHNPLKICTSITNISLVDRSPTHGTALSIHLSALQVSTIRILEASQTNVPCHNSTCLQSGY